VWWACCAPEAFVPETDSLRHPSSSLLHNSHTPDAVCGSRGWLVLLQEQGAIGRPWEAPTVQEFTPAEALANDLISHADAVEMGYITDEERKVLWKAAITAWTTADKARRVANAHKRDEIGNLKGADRLVHLRNSLIENCVRFYRENPRSDVAPGLLGLITFLSDNARGCCHLSIARMAQIFDRSETSVGLALHRLVACDVLGMEERPGDTAHLWPITTQFERAPPIWFVDAFSSERKRGRPKTAPLHLGAFPEKPPASSGAHFRGEGKNLPSATRKPPRSSGDDSSLSSQKDARGRAREGAAGGEPSQSPRAFVEAMAEAITDGDAADPRFAAFWRLRWAAGWGGSASAAFADESLTETIERAEIVQAWRSTGSRRAMRATPSEPPDCWPRWRTSTPTSRRRCNSRACIAR
jgi:hypothetical protein